jgi:hypothetical protein
VRQVRGARPERVQRVQRVERIERFQRVARIERAVPLQDAARLEGLSGVLGDDATTGTLSITEELHHRRAAPSRSSIAFGVLDSTEKPLEIVV